MPPTRVRKVILHVSEKSTPDAPAAIPVPVPSETPPSPPPQPPKMLPSNTPILNDSQHGVGTPGIVPTYAPPHGGTFYPPVPVYPQFQPPFPPYGGISAIQPWSYTHYTPEQVAELARRFPVRPFRV
jgi:hypothetical protein